MATVSLLLTRGSATRERALIASAAAVCAFVALDRVLSAQYLIWLVPLVIAIPRRGGIAPSGLLGVAIVLTQLWFPIRYFQLLAFAALPSWLVFSRDVVLLILLGTLAWSARPRSAGSCRRGRRSSG